MSVNGDSGSITDVWANDIDGPFAESPDQFINIWTLSSSSNNGVANILNGLFVSVASVMPRLPPGGLSAQVRPDFLYSYTNFGVQFQDRTSAPGAIESYIWVFDDGYGSKRPSPLHLYPCAGRYLVTLYVRDEFQNRDDVSKIVLVNESTPLCGILAMPRPEAPINTTTQWLTIYEVFFVFLVFFSGASLLMGWDFPLLNKRVRWFLLWLSLALLSISFLLR
jgi:PKD repeat protein